MFGAISPAHVGFESLSSVVVTEIERLDHGADRQTLQMLQRTPAARTTVLDAIQLQRLLFRNHAQSCNQSTPAACS